MKGSNSPKSRRPPKSPTSGVSFGRGETPSSPSVRFRDETQASLEEPGGGLEIALAVDPKLVEPVKTLSRVPTTPASPRG